MKRLAVVAIVLAAAACAGDQTEATDTAAPAAGALEAPAPSAAATDSAARADSIARADSAAKAAGTTP